LSAQNDLQINLSNVLVYEIDFNYEHVLSDYATVGGMIGYVYDFPGESYPATYFYIGPEIRYYVAPKHGADRFFIGAYFRYKNGETHSVYEESGETSSGYYGYYSQDIIEEYNKLAFGFTVGSKWMAESGFLYGLYAGIGRNIIADYSSTSSVDSHEDEFIPDTYHSHVYSYSKDSEYWDFRVGFMVGFRLGKN